MSLYQVFQMKQTLVEWLMGSERGYDVSGVSEVPIPVLGEESGTKVSSCLFLFFEVAFDCKSEL